MNKKLLIYISVPINGRKHGTLPEKKIAAKKQSDAIKSKLQADGYDAITPFDIIPVESEVTEAYALGKCIEKVIECDGIYYCSGWRMSKGCRIESVTASEYSKVVIGDEV